MKSAFLLVRFVTILCLIAIISIAGITVSIRNIISEDLNRFTSFEEINTTRTNLLKLQNNLEKLENNLKKFPADLTSVQNNLPPDTAKLITPIIRESQTALTDSQNANTDSQNAYNALQTTISETSALYNAYSAKLATLNFLLSLSVFITTLLFISLIFSFWAEKNAKRDSQINYERGKNEGMREGVIRPITTLDEDPSVLRNIMIWLYDYSRNKGDVNAAFNIFTQLLSRFSSLSLRSIGKIGQVVDYDPAKHRNYQLNIKKGEKVMIVETGWTLENQLIRKPLVEWKSNE